MSGFEFDFRMGKPGGPLGRAVDPVWYARGTVPYRRERIALTGSTVAVILLGDPDHRMGHSRPASRRAEDGRMMIRGTVPRVPAGPGAGR